MSVETKDTPNALTQNSLERRSEPRTPLIAQAEVADIASGVKLSARVSDLSLSGCYLDALTPLPEGSDVHLRISFNDERLALRAKIRFSHPGLGMGVQFDAPTGEQMQVLSNWLTAIGAKPPAQAAAAPPRVAPEKDQRKALQDLISLLNRKGILNEGEAAQLLAKL
ncbi:MAG TPA: PilZ domain-containing protein [Candidatus Acidoferrales bacterium]|nr:PilZ domain-containing protein [Candidatus Acidoferrales bacterium]